MESLTLEMVTRMRISMHKRSSMPFVLSCYRCLERDVSPALKPCEGISRGREGIVYAVSEGISVLINLLTRGDPVIPFTVSTNAVWYVLMSQFASPVDAMQPMSVFRHGCTRPSRLQLNAADITYRRPEHLVLGQRPS